jgi:hypothetical protein
MISKNQPIGDLWALLSQKTGQRLAVHNARAQWVALSVAVSEILNGEQRPVMPAETVELLRNARYEANSKAAIWNRRIADIDAEIADLQRQIEGLDKCS